MARLPRVAGLCWVLTALAAAIGAVGAPAARAVAPAVPQVLDVESSPTGHVSILLRTPNLYRPLPPSDFTVTPTAATGPVSARTGTGRERELVMLVDVGTVPAVRDQISNALITYAKAMPPFTRVAVVMANGLSPLVAPSSTDVAHTVAALRSVRAGEQGDPQLLVTTALQQFSSVPGRSRTLMIAAARDEGLQSAVAAAGRVLSGRHVELTGAVAAASAPPALLTLDGVPQVYGTVALAALPARLGGLSERLTPIYRLNFQRHRTPAQTMHVAIRGEGTVPVRLPEWHRGLGISSFSGFMLSHGAAWLLGGVVALLLVLLVGGDAAVASRNVPATAQAATLTLGRVRLSVLVAALGTVVVLLMALRMVAILH